MGERTSLISHIVQNHLHEALVFVAKLSFWRDIPSQVVLGKASTSKSAEFNFQISPNSTYQAQIIGKLANER